MTNPSLLDDFPAPICRTDPRGNLSYCNRAWADFTGRPPAEQLGSGWVRSIHPEDREGCLGAYTQAVSAAKPFECEYRLRRWDGEYRWVFDIGRPFYDRDHRCSGYVRVCYDNTDRKLSGDSLRALARRLDAPPAGDRAAGRFGSREDISLALTALLIHLALMQSELPDDAGEAQRRLKSALDLVQYAVEALWEPAVHTGGSTPDVSGLNLALMSYCDEATNQYNIPINYSGVEIPRLNSDVGLAMMRLLQAGLADALESARASRISVALNHRGRLLRLTIEDNGNGANMIATDTPEAVGPGWLEIRRNFKRLGGAIETDFQSGRGGCLTGLLPVK